MATWDKQQAVNGIPLIDRTYKVKRPNGDVAEVNRFDFNLAYCADRDTYIQCTDTGWIRIRNLTVLKE